MIFSFRERLYYTLAGTRTLQTLQFLYRSRYEVYGYVHGR